MDQAHPASGVLQECGQDVLQRCTVLDGEHRLQLRSQHAHHRLPPICVLCNPDLFFERIKKKISVDYRDSFHRYQWATTHLAAAAVEESKTIQIITFGASRLLMSNLNGLMA